MGMSIVDPRATRIDFLEPEAGRTQADPLPRRPDLGIVGRKANGEAGRVLPLRRFRRARVALPAVVVIDRNRSFEALTADISEGGILVEPYSGPQLEPGRLVGLAVRGVISDADNADDNVYLMRVIRHQRGALALAFAD